MNRLRFKLLGLAMVLVMTSACFAEDPEIVNDNKDVLTPGAKLVAGLPGKNDFYILGKNEKMPAELTEQKKAPPKIVLDKPKQAQPVVVQEAVETANASTPAPATVSTTIAPSANDLVGQPIPQNGQPANATVQSVSQTQKMQTSEKQVKRTHPLASATTATNLHGAKKLAKNNATHNGASKKLAQNTMTRSHAAKKLAQNNVGKNAASKKLAQSSAVHKATSKKLAQGNAAHNAASKKLAKNNVAHGNASKKLAQNNPQHQPAAKSTKKIAQRQGQPAYLQFGKV